MHICHDGAHLQMSAFLGNLGLLEVLLDRGRLVRSLDILRLQVDRLLDTRAFGQIDRLHAADHGGLELLKHVVTLQKQF